eukprot:SAG11_NODE_15755_length_567_cov_1.064103_1_plen_91_part_01
MLKVRAPTGRRALAGSASPGVGSGAAWHAQLVGRAVRRGEALSLDEAPWRTADEYKDGRLGLRSGQSWDVTLHCEGRGVVKPESRGTTTAA